MENSVNVREARPRHDALDIDASVLLVSAPASACSSALRGAKSTCPPSDARGTSRPSTFGSSAMPSPVPAAISATLPRASASPFVQHLDLVRRENGHRPRERFEVVEQVGARNRHSLRSASRSTIHGTFVNCARVACNRARHAEARRFDVGRAVEVSRRKCRTGRPRSGKSSVRYERISMASGRAPLERRGRGRFLFRQRRRRAASLMIVTGRGCLTSTRPYCIFLASARVNAGELRRARRSAACRAEAGPIMTRQPRTLRSPIRSSSSPANFHRSAARKRKRS